MICAIHRALASFAVLAAVSAQAQTSTGNPTEMVVTLFRTEVIPVDVAANGTFTVGTPEVVFESAAGAPVDLVGNAGGIFGAGDVPVGRYDRIRLTVGNAITYSTGEIVPCTAVTDQPLLVDGALAGSAQTTLTFATAATGGGASWRSNGTDVSPFLLNAPIMVAESATTRVRFQFDTQDTVVCAANTISIPDAPAMRVESMIVPSSAAFAGGEYWIGFYSAGNIFWTRSDLLEACGAGCDPYGVDATPQDRANYRASYGFNLGWGGTITLSAADTEGNGTMTISGLLENRRRVVETGCSEPECGVMATGGETSAPFGYSLGADRRFTAVTSKGIFYGGFNEDFSMWFGVMVETGRGRPDDASMMFGVRKSGAQSLTGVYGLDWAFAELTYPIVATVQQPEMTELNFGSFRGWLSFDDQPHDGSTFDAGLYASMLGMGNPARSATASSNRYEYNHGGKAGRFPGFTGSSLEIGADGTGTYDFLGMATLWAAADDGGHSVLVAGDTGTTNSYYGDQATATRLEQLYGLLLKQAPAGTHTLAGLAGSWLFVSRVDQLVEQVIDPSTTDAIVSKRAEWGSIITDPLGTATFEVNSVDDTGLVTGMIKVGTFAVVQACIGGSDLEVPLAWDLAAAECAAASGRFMDIGILSAPGSDGVTAEEVAWFQFNDNGSAASFVSPDGFDLVDPTRGHHRLLGYALRTAR